MEYCPFCSGELTKPVKVCPHCKKSLDMDIYQAVFEPGESSKLNKRARRSLWYKENSRYIFPFIFLIIGLVVGSTVMFGYAAFHFQAKQNALDEEIVQLKTQVGQIEKSTGAVSDSLDHFIAQQDTVIQILAEENKLVRQIITFTRRMARNSSIIPNTPNEAAYYRRNFRYLNSQYEAQQQKLSETFFIPEQNYNLETIPELLQD